jgi:hypothetical protein
MDILHLVDRLEELFNESRALPFTRNVVVDEDKMLDIIDQMRVAIPEEVKKAQQMLAQKDRVMAQAQEEATRIVSLAKEKRSKSSSARPLSRAHRPAPPKSSTRRVKTPTLPATTPTTMLSIACKTWKKKSPAC